ncbi:unnamed protein product [Enterobius vermicularis]|uniref:Ion_trans domain-containing protein n=1 Tax=Enterobius vermicularis TaxID=51028 RepID=A0A0N4V9B4_ENTVE|nr:unnamed protein product [Enterobius vermicularis]
MVFYYENAAETGGLLEPHIWVVVNRFWKSLCGDLPKGVYGNVRVFVYLSVVYVYICVCVIVFVSVRVMMVLMLNADAADDDDDEEGRRETKYVADRHISCRQQIFQRSSYCPHWLRFFL